MERFREMFGKDRHRERRDCGVLLLMFGGWVESEKLKERESGGRRDREGEIVRTRER